MQHTARSDTQNLPRPAAKMRFLVPVFVFLTVAAVHTALSASLESAVKEETVTPYDGLTELQKIDQMEFEAAQKIKAAEMNVTEQQGEDARYLEAAQGESEEKNSEAEEDSTEGGSNTDAAAHEESQSSEETDERQRRDHHEAVTEVVSSLDDVSQDSSKEPGVLE
uniref:uncharacterized protein LOC109963426 isoform X2 n=1 Tax=Monopterus albus TaxID=43700 RepID=UPI0009B3A060|nr:uncharacterized protein LOC109963426 isoform X2 [Monopterus albus]